MQIPRETTGLDRCSKQHFSIAMIGSFRTTAGWPMYGDDRRPHHGGQGLTPPASPGYNLPGFPCEMISRSYFVTHLSLFVHQICSPVPSDSFGSLSSLSLSLLVSVSELLPYKRTGASSCWVLTTPIVVVISVTVATSSNSSSSQNSGTTNDSSDGPSDICTCSPPFGSLVAVTHVELD